MTRFFIPADHIRGDKVFLEGSDHHHLLNVLRKKVGDEITVLNGKGEEFLARVIEIKPSMVIAEIVTAMNRPAEPRVKINLIQGLPKADKFEWIIQKNTELGVSRFQPVITERSTIRLDAEARTKKWERWSKIIKSAAEQSGRTIIPELEMVKDWELAIRNLRPGLTLIPWEGETERSLKSVLEAEKVLPTEVNVIIGPEGGFSIQEINEAREYGAIPITLGPRILRTETAGLVAATSILYHFGDMG
ncbi:MAG TPA: 16S rRNA (uracil(1498)-N(3))-methyltransferase [Bacillota bacterium]|nr:16S rRNA (uracil(1498)-N(3))-methyltransferase [Bacillota bacterium]HPT87778.1 16S rRNA (uracil(1498)-N(3))-methyltransferase [Bacillota bacterium]